jgi:hypothetical protein
MSIKRFYRKRARGSKEAAGVCGRCGLWELNQFLPVTYRLYGSCQNRAKVKIAIQDVMVQHNFKSLAREASAALAASF